MKTENYVLPPRVSKSREVALKGAKAQPRTPSQQTRVERRPQPQSIARALYPGLPSIHDRKPTKGES
jgi:hypothetical protein